MENSENKKYILVRFKHFIIEEEKHTILVNLDFDCVIFSCNKMLNMPHPCNFHILEYKKNSKIRHMSEIRHI